MKTYTRAGDFITDWQTAKSLDLGNEFLDKHLETFLETMEDYAQQFADAR